VEEERIKSAFEIAMERISGLPELTPEEIAAQKEKEYGPIGTTLAVKYMNGTITDSELPIELKRHQEDRRRIIRRALVTSLCREMVLDGTKATAMKALSGIEQIAPEIKDDLRAVEEDYLKTVGEFEAARNERFREFEIMARERMKSFGISGSAVRPNIIENEQWQKELAAIQQSYEPRLSGMRNALIQRLESA
jgi:hypothetical protein